MIGQEIHVLSVREVAEALGVSRHAIYAGVARGEIPTMGDTPIQIPASFVHDRP